MKSDDRHDDERAAQATRRRDTTTHQLAEHKERQALGAAAARRQSVSIVERATNADDVAARLAHVVAQQIPRIDDIAVETLDEGTTVDEGTNVSARRKEQQGH